VGRLEGRVAFITGASSGIGAALGREFARRGAHVALGARRVDRLESLAAELTRLGHRAIVISCDVTREGELEAAVARTREALGRIDVLVANAGFGVMGRLEVLTLQDYRRQFETNVFGVLRTIYAGLDEIKRTRGRIVIMGSVAGHLGAPGSSAYAMSKFAVRGLAQALAPELAAHGVAVTLVSPGFVESEIHEVDNRGVRHPGAHDAVKWLRMPGEKAARQIVSATVRRRREVVITGHGKAIVFLQRHAPWLVAWLVRRSGVRQHRREAAAPPAADAP